MRTNGESVPYFDEIIEKTNTSMMAVADILKSRDAMVKDDIDFLVKESLEARERMTSRMLERETKWRSIVDDLILLVLPGKRYGDNESDGEDDTAKPTGGENKRKRSFKAEQQEETKSETYEFGKWPRWG